MAIGGALPTKAEKQTIPVQSDQRQVLVQLNNLAADLLRVAAGISGQGILTSAGLAIGSTDTNLANVAFTFNIAGIPASKAAVAAGTAFGALGTVPADTWAIIAADIIAAGTVTFVSGAANYTTGYATEAAAVAALPAATAAKARMGYITLKTKAATVWIAGTDALAGGATGNPASVTHYTSTLPLGDTSAFTFSQIVDAQGNAVTYN